MGQYINKSALVSEIKKRAIEACLHDGVIAETREDECYSILSFLDTLEVKEVRDIWHDVSEKPELEQPLLIIMKGTHKDFRKHYRIGCYGKRANDIPTWVINGCYSDSFISKWCYISDILKQTIEVKEADLEKEIELIKGDYEQVDVAWNNDFDFIARHFYELGLKTWKGE